MIFSDICIITTDVKKIRAFYELIFNEKAEGDEIHSFIECGGLGLAIYNKTNAINDMGFNFENAGTGLLTIGFNVEDVTVEYQRILELNVNQLTKPVVWPWGAKSFNFRDPDGNIIVIRSLLNDDK